MAEDFYKVLGVAKDAPADVVKKAYRKLAKDLHPDRNPGDAAAESRFKSVNQAFDALGDPKKRKLYDEFGEEGLREGFDPERVRAYRQWGGGGGGGRRGGGAGGWGGGQQTVNLEDLFSGQGGGGGGVGDIFGDLFGQRGGRSRGPQKGADMETEMTIDLASAVRGTTVEFRSPSGGGPATVRIPPGASEGSRVRVPGHGAPSPNGGPAGDLVIILHVAAHPNFRLEGDDLHLELPITVAEAYRGAKVTVPTAEGSVVLKVPELTQSGAVLRLRGKGIARKNKLPGDVYVKFQIRIPTERTPELDELVEKLGALQTGDVRADVKL